jgi:hypothetical protein
VFEVRPDSYNAGMRLALKLHPDAICAAVTGIEVDISHPRPGSLAMAYMVAGKIGELRIPPRAEPRRADELWKQTCFEVFIRTSPEAEYYEFNLSPSTQWAAYQFTGHRSGMRVANEIQAIPISTDPQAKCYALLATLDLDQMKLPRGPKWQIGLSAVIEELDGRKSYWALAHPPGKPDFHHSICFTHEFS